MDVESALKMVGHFGRFQKFIVVTCFIGNIGYGCQMVLMVIVGATPNLDIPSERNLTTIVTEWNLENRQWIVALISSLFMASYAVGVFIMGQASDLFGRKWPFVLNFSAMLVAGLCGAFCQDWQVFAVTRSFAGFFAGSSGNVLFALLVENIGKEYWALVGMSHSLFFSMGVMLLSLCGATLQSWRKVCIAVSVFPAAFLPIYIIFVPESARWLYHVGKVERAEKVLRYICEKNGRPVAGVALRSTNDNELLLTEELKKYSIIDIFRSRKLAIYAVSSFYIWFACSFVYYGLTLDASTLSPNIYIATILSGVIEIPATLLTYLCMRSKWIGRKGTIVFSFVLSGISSVGLLFAEALQIENMALAQTVLGLLNKLSVAGAFSLLYIYCAEIFPTQLRLVAMGGSSMFARVGAIISPFVPLLAPLLSYVPYAVFGTIAVMGAFLTLFLPETLNMPNPEMSDFLPTKSKRLHVAAFPDVDPSLFSDDETEALVNA